MPSADPPRVLVAGGGTAGHVEPALATADALCALVPGAQVVALGTAAGLEASLVPQRGYRLALVPRVPLPRRPTPDLLTVPGRLRAAVRAAEAAIVEHQVEVVVGFGGYVALPAYLAARRRGVPVVVHEANVRAGLANRIGARSAARVCVARAGIALPRAEVVGIPLRASISTLDRAAARADARAVLHLDPDRPVLLVTGGSQGARSINEAVVGAAAALVAAGVQVVHVTGVANAPQVREQLPAGLEHYHVLDYVEDMSVVYSAADLALCRAGAMTCAELSTVGLPAVFVPLPIGNGEQRLNAQPLVDAGGGLLVDDADLDPALVVGQVLPLVTDGGRVTAMADALRAVTPPQAAQRLAAIVLEVVDAARSGRAGRMQR